MILAIDAKIHDEVRIKTTSRTLYALQGDGLCINGAKPSNITHMFSAAVLPVLSYGLQCVSQNKSVMENVEMLQPKLLNLN